MARVKLGLEGLPATGLVAKAQAMHDAVVANATIFPNPIPTPPEFQALIDELAAANAAVDANRGRKEYLERDNADAALRLGVKQWAGYVQMVSGGDATTIRLSTFEVVKRGSPVGELPPPTNLATRLTRTTGRAALVWDREEGTDTHHVYMSTSNDPFNWELIGVTSKSRYNVDNLEPGKFYWFAVTAIGAAGESSMSEPCRVMAAA
ncbi:MAG: fibronectin type III domain-containing protein [Flavobacteriales bacterium]|nr:MAG: fibronectin type III domain-containing protein [Flavobacteriales bacterium]